MSTLLAACRYRPMKSKSGSVVFTTVADLPPVRLVIWHAPQRPLCGLRDRRTNIVSSNRAVLGAVNDSPFDIGFGSGSVNVP